MKRLGLVVRNGEFIWVVGKRKVVGRIDIVGINLNLGHVTYIDHVTMDVFVASFFNSWFPFW